jgi:ElaB/YqjD/DUF883 family membrane-anchored ribosome-binding protein
MFFQVVVECGHCHSEFRATLGVEPVAPQPRCPSCGHTLFQLVQGSGFVYVLSNPRIPGLHKIAGTDRSVIDRVAELNSAPGVPSPFVIEAYFGTADPQGHELAVHQRLREHRVPSREFFEVALRDAVTAIEEVVGSAPWFLRSAEARSVSTSRDGQLRDSLDSVGHSGTSTMGSLEKTARFGAIALAVLVLVLSLCGVFGVWFVKSRATDVALKGFGAIETGVGVVDTGVGRVDDLIAKRRTEVNEAAETIVTVAAQAKANSPLLNALNERLEKGLAPRIAQMQQVLAPVRDALAAVGNALSLLNPLPMMGDRAPRLAALDGTFNRLEELTADITQLRGTLRALVEQKGDVAPETVAALKGITQRIDTRLGEAQTNVQAVRADVAELQVRLDTRKSRLLFAFNLLAMISTLMLAWVVYTQVVVIQHHRGRLRPPVA